MWVILLASFAFATTMMLFDGIQTAKGVKSGIAVEGNGLIVRLVGDKPTLAQFVMIETPIRVAMLLPGLLFHPDALPYMFSALAIPGFIVYGIKNLQGARAWLALEKK